MGARSVGGVPTIHPSAGFFNGESSGMVTRGRHPTGRLPRGNEPHPKARERTAHPAEAHLAHEPKAPSKRHGHARGARR